MRFYGEDRKPVIEIARHPECVINKGDGEHPIWHFHKFDGVRHLKANILADRPDIIAKYSVYLKEVGYVF